MVMHCLLAAPEPLSLVSYANYKALALKHEIVVEVLGFDAVETTFRNVDIAIFFVDPAHAEEGLRVLAECTETVGSPPILVIGDDLNPCQVTQLINHGAADFALTPLLPEELVLRMQCLLGQIPRIHKRNVRAALDPRNSNLIGSSPIFLSKLAKLPVLAGCDAAVLILGDTGTGKEEFARGVHYLSARAGKPLIAINCAAIPSELFENELFGHARGAYTTALTGQDGLIRQAEGGSLFLDEIDALPYGAQAKLLRFLQDKEFRPLGSNNVHRADVRIIAASNHGLLELVRTKTFREDLYFRLNVLRLDLPPLSERREDIPVLALHFLNEFTDRYHRPAIGFSPGALRKLLIYNWPGNVRELRNVIERAVLTSEELMLRDEHIELGENQDTPVDNSSFKASKARIVSSFEKAYIEGLLVANNGNVSHAALAAQKNRRAFFELMRKHKVDPNAFRH